MALRDLAMRAEASMKKAAPGVEPGTAGEGGTRDAAPRRQPSYERLEVLAA